MPPHLSNWLPTFFVAHVHLGGRGGMLDKSSCLDMYEFQICCERLKKCVENTVTCLSRSVPPNLVPTT